MNNPNKTFKNIFLNKNWIIFETPNAVEIYSPEQYFNQSDKDINVGIWFSKTIAMPSIKFDNQMVIGINFDQDYEIVTSYRNSNKVEKEIIKGKELYAQLEKAKDKIKSKYFPTYKKSFNSNNSNDNNTWLE